MSLPKWVEGMGHGECIPPKCGRCQLLEALAIAWEELERVATGRIVHKPNFNETLSYDARCAKEAMRRIEKIGGPVEPNCTCYGPPGNGHSPSCKKELWNKLNRNGLAPIFFVAMIFAALIGAGMAYDYKNNKAEDERMKIPTPEEAVSLMVQSSTAPAKGQHLDQCPGKPKGELCWAGEPDTAEVPSVKTTVPPTEPNGCSMVYQEESSTGPRGTSACGGKE